MKLYVRIFLPSLHNTRKGPGRRRAVMNMPLEFEFVDITQGIVAIRR
jgi:hypothetical protein